MEHHSGSVDSFSPSDSCAIAHQHTRKKKKKQHQRASKPLSNLTHPIHTLISVPLVRERSFTPQGRLSPSLIWPHPFINPPRASDPLTAAARRTDAWCLPQGCCALGWGTVDGLHPPHPMWPQQIWHFTPAAALWVFLGSLWSPPGAIGEMWGSAGEQGPWKMGG